MVSKAEVLQVAKLAHLDVDPSEADRLTNEFNAILEYIQQLEKIDVTNVDPMSHVHGITNVFREDAATTFLSTKEALQNAPDTCGSFIRVPIIIEPGEEH